MANRLLRNAVGLTDGVVPSPLGDLSDRELEVFRLIGAGKTTAEVAEQLHLNIHTVETYRQRIKSKLNLRNTAELSRTAVQWVLNPH